MALAAALGIARPRAVRATRYVEPLREGGSLPALVEADDDGLYVVKLHGAGQGARALVAELIAGEIARRLGLAVPELAYVALDPALALAEPDPEIQDLLRASPGLNLGLDYLPGALAYTSPLPGAAPDPALAAAVVWLDALVTNVDRTPRNPNLLCWHGRLWLIDHGAALYVHHRTWDLAPAATRHFTAIADHVLLPHAGSITDADERLAPALDPATLEAIVALVPAAWLVDREDGPDAADDPEPLAAARRAAYVEYLTRRLRAPRGFAAEAEAARAGAR